MRRSRRIRLQDPPKFKNVVEKQRYFDELVKKYGQDVKGRQDFVYSYDQKLPDLFPSAQVESQNEMYQQELGTSPPEPPSPYAMYDQIPPNSYGQTWKGVIERQKKNLKINPMLLYTSLMEEGGNKQLAGKPSSQINGAMSFGLDTIGDRVDEFVKKGYLDKNFKRRLTTADFTNEKGQKSLSGYLNTYDDVLMAKQAFMLSAKDKAVAEAKKLKVNLTPKAIDYLMLVGYNYGEGGMKKLMVDMAKQGAFQNDKFLDPAAMKGYDVPRKNAARRMKLAEMLQNEWGDTPTQIPSTKLSPKR